ncbi:MAG: prephenate dehydrogenase [Anaerolineales bacterium]
MNESNFSLKSANIVIIGLGLMGGSLALSLKEHCRELRATDSHPPTLKLARQMDIVHVVGSDPAKILSDADLVILACPVPAIIEWVHRLPGYVQHPCIVLDIGSSKRKIVTALDNLPPNFDPLGGHAICGRERLSLENAEDFLYQDAPFVLTPSSRTSDNARQAALQIIEVLGADPIWLDAKDHDRILASTSHLPYLISSALALVTSKNAVKLIGPGFRSSIRLAGTPSSMMHGVLLSNRDNVLGALRSLQDQLSKIESALEENDTSQLKTILDTAQDQFQSLIQ